MATGAAVGDAAAVEADNHTGRMAEATVAAVAVGYAAAAAGAAPVPVRRRTRR